MNEVSIRDLVGIHDDLDSAIFFDGSGEYLNTGKYTPDEWREKVNSFLEGYQKVLNSNTVVAKHDYFLREKDYEMQLAYFGEPVSRTTSKQHNSLKDELEKDRPEEPFEGYYDLMQKMSIPAEALKEALEESGDYSVARKLPRNIENTEKFDDFTFTIKKIKGKISTDIKVTDVQYKGNTLELHSKQAKTFLWIMRKCYGNTNTISISEINEFNHCKGDSDGNVRTIISKIKQL